MPLPDTSQDFHLVAENQFGRFAGAQYSFQTTHGSPAPVGGVPISKTVAASGVTRTDAKLNGQVTSNKSETQYWFEYGTTANLGYTTAVVNVGDASVNLTVTAVLADLSPATTYYFRMNAQNQFGTVNGSILTFKTSGPPAATGPSVTTRTATSVSSSSATLRGTVNPNGAETTYWFEYSKDAAVDSPNMQTTPKIVTGASRTSISVNTDISNVASSTTYYFRIVAQNSEGTVRGERLSFTTR